MKKSIFFFLILLFFSIKFQLIGQNYTTLKSASEPLKTKYLEGLQYNKKGEFDKSVKVFSKLLKTEPRFIDARIQLAAALEELKSIDLAIDEYKNVLKIDTLYETRVLKALGRLLKDKKNYQEAAYFYLRFSVIGVANAESKNNAKLEAESCIFIDSALRNKWSVKSENLGPAINTQNHEYLPCLSVDGQTLIFTRVVNGNEDFYKSTKDKDGNWVTAQAITELNTNSNEGAQSISADGKTIVFTACDYKDSNGSCDLYISYLVGTNWSPPKNMGPVVNSISWDSQPSLSANGNQLFFASNRLGGFGGSDIWVSEKSITGVWQMPKPMPSPINDAYKSESPFIHPDGKTLYFRSDRKPGFGGFDLFMSRLSPEGIWSTPINLGSPINSSNDEGALIISLDGEFAYYASDKLDKSGSEIGYVNYGKNDIYRFKMPEQLKPGLVTYVKGKVIDQNTKNGLLAKIEIKTLGNNTSLVEMKTDLDGSFLFCIPAGASYALNVSKEGYAFNSQNFTLDLQKKAEPFYLEIPLQRLLSGDLKSNKPIVLNNIFFDTGASNLRADSDFELDKLYELLNNNKQLKIQINGHTDDIGNESDNLKLSENRAKSVYEYLIKKGISSDRLNYKGFGESMPLVENKDAESRQINRRTEFEIK